ncbi:hypothetical protein PBY51_009373 [Eleginops maclovinus]|uniref:Uncharacterized protein n=1 Tax=Eleginops maclovinus TaxID=56733 RepID=A0AAN8AUX0_ELEMC|nr:hypothetical protein PBY51_009373 [Eleginops maclovinus]
MICFAQFFHRTPCRHFSRHNETTKTLPAQQSPPLSPCSRHSSLRKIQCVHRRSSVSSLEIKVSVSGLGLSGNASSCCSLTCPSLCILVPDRREQEKNADRQRARHSCVEKRSASPAPQRQAPPRNLLTGGASEGGRRLLVSGRSCMGAWKPSRGMYAGPRK